MSLEERINALRHGNLSDTCLYRFLEQDAVKVPNIGRHPVAMINEREPMNSDNDMAFKPSTGAHAQANSSVEASHQFGDVSHAIAQPKLDTTIIYTARIVSNIVLARQVKIDADLQGCNLIGRLLNTYSRGSAEPRLRVPQANRGGLGGGPSGSCGRGYGRGRDHDLSHEGRRGRGHRNDRHESPSPTDPPKDNESALERFG
ncbi:hypothetical protein F4859DRAFT_481123, partial [Xylaria cf. heliscus]